MIEGVDFLSNIVSVIVTAVVTWAGTFLFYRQKRDSLDIENEARRSEEWRKLYVESQKDSRDKDRKIDELRRSMRTMQQQIIDLQFHVRINSIYRCEDMACERRRPPIQNDITTETDHYDQSDRPGPHFPRPHAPACQEPFVPQPAETEAPDPDDPDAGSYDLDR